MCVCVYFFRRVETRNHQQLSFPLIVASYYLHIFWVPKLHQPFVLPGREPGWIHLTAAWPITTRHSLQVLVNSLGTPKVDDFQKRNLSR